jgi:hypothetical protein
MPTSNLDGCLLCASGAAYDVVADQATLPLDPTDVYLTGAGFLRPPVGLVGGPLAIDACLVGEIADGFVVAFRGTLPLDLHSIPDLRDWLNDVQADPISVAGFPGSIHAGFSNALAVLLPKILVELANQQAASASPGRPVYVTGHSKGGAVAALAAWSLIQAGITPTKVVTFAAAKPADATFSAAYNATGIVHARYEFGDDIVPHLPLSDGGFLDVLSHLPVIGKQYTVLNRFDYQPVGSLLYIENNGVIIADTSWLRSQRDLSLAMLVLKGQFAQIAADHSLGCGSGYMNAVDPGICPPKGT